MDLLRHFKTQWILYETRKLSKDAHSKKSYTKAGHVLGSECPDLISRGNLFGAIPATVPFIIQQSCVLMCHWTTEDLFRIQCSVLNPRTQWNRFPTVHVSYSTIQCLQPVHGQQDTSLSRKCIHPHNKTVV
ncbi:hypothetical protein TNCT_719641 [Trichonephila clavata]|uniref:Uncharacterized protein n=1 Tax=Trichonephila clavata TaxID=2740835 RepID=A0A8X6HYD9_TRICU|nr:hypothetical protein TNCT_719641 [Trichonephila clavata]